MIAGVCSFTKKGRELEQKIKQKLPQDVWIAPETIEKTQAFVASAFSKSLPLVFIGACGIAVRLTAPFVKDKFTDSAVVVIDEKARFVIPLLSGHLGGANMLALKLADALNAQCVVTTATDVENVFSVDVFAQKNSLCILNREGVKEVSRKILEGHEVSVRICRGIEVLDKNIPSNLRIVDEEDADVLILSDISARERGRILTLAAKNLCLGIGCRQGKSFEEIKAFIEKKLEQNQIKDISSISSINLKSKEAGLLELAQFYHVPFHTYSSMELEKASAAEGKFFESEFVRIKTGVSNVCERAAALTAGQNAALTLRKTAENGITLACAKRTPAIITWNTSMEEWSEE